MIHAIVHMTLLLVKFLSSPNEFIELYIFRTCAPISQNLSIQVIYWKGLLLIHSMAHGPRD